MSGKKGRGRLEAWTIRSGLIVCLAAAAFVPACSREADDATDPSPDAGVREISLVGTVSVSRNAEGAITAISITSRKGTTYQIELDTTGKQLAQQADGTEVQVRGSTVSREGRRWLTVERLEPVEPKPAQEENADKEE